MKQTQQQDAAQAARLTQAHSVAGPQQSPANPISVPGHPLAALSSNSARVGMVSAQRKAISENGLPDSLKSGIETLSGMSMDHVKVHYNSQEPARINAHAYTQGSNIYVAPGQEKHLAHEAWHVVQQAQGRVTPTLQMKDGVSGNDDRRLELEADVMGARADDAGRAGRSIDSGAQVGPTHLSRAIFSANGPRQLRVSIVTSEEKDAESFYDKVVKDREKYGVTKNIVWHSFASNIYAVIDRVRSVVSDDADAAVEVEVEMKEMEARADALVVQGNAAVKRFNETNETGRSTRLNPSERMEIIGQLIKIRKDLTNLQCEINETYSLSEGGFNAKGRAAEIKNVIISPVLSGKANAFIDNITLNGHALNTRRSIIKPATSDISGPQRLRVNGVTVDDPDSFLRKREEMTILEKKLGETPLKETRNVTVTGHFNKVGREGGQEKNMNDTNARGYAWITDTPGWDTTRWEWLHVQGAALAGETNPTNLVLGTRDSNTHMMPFESNLKSLATLAKDDSRYENLTVTWSVEEKRKFKHRWDVIRITWNLNKKDDQDDAVPEPSGDAVFSPLKTGSVLSKVEVAYLEEALKEAREDKNTSAVKQSSAVVKAGKKKVAASGGGERKHTRPNPILPFDDMQPQLADYVKDGTDVPRKAAPVKDVAKIVTKKGRGAKVTTSSPTDNVTVRPRVVAASHGSEDSEDRAPNKEYKGRPINASDSDISSAPPAVRGLKKRKDRQTAASARSVMAGPARRTRAKTVATTGNVSGTKEI